MGVFAQAENEGVGVFDNKILDEWNIPFGEWVDQGVDWIDVNMGGPLAVIRWPFQILFEGFVEGFLVKQSWILVCIAFFIIGSLIRNLKVGTQAALSLAGCGLLGVNYWEETIRTIGMILVAVILCAIVGIPLGILCGRFDGVWNVVRPTLDAMQVVHAFVYMLPIIFFFSIGVVPGTMVTMIFALPPLIRLTNLGIRQVPEDVVEASRAYGAPELRVLRDVQLPLARPAIMTGLNQTLLLAISMIGIAAIMGAGGLGLLVFRAVSNLDTGLAASAGLALFLVAIVLDRISQPEAGDAGNLAHRIKSAWAHRTDVTPLLDAAGDPAKAKKAGPRFEGVHPQGRIGALIAAAGALVGVVSVFLTWGEGAGLITAYSRRSDVDLSGQSFDGLAASGGSFFGYVVFASSIFILASVAMTLSRPGEGPRFLSPDGSMMFAGAMLFAAIGYLVINPSPQISLAEASYSHGIGVYAAVLAGVVSFIGAYLWLQKAPYSPHRPLKLVISRGRIFTGIVVTGMLVIAMFSGWTFDKRADTVLTPEIAAQMDELIARAEADPAQANVIAGQIAALQASAQKDLVVIDGLTDQGAGLGLPVFLIGLLGVAALLPAAGLMGFDEHKQWRWSAVSTAFGMGLMAIATGWVGSLLRATDPRLVSGIGAFLVFIAGYFLYASNRGTLQEFRRQNLYDDDHTLPGDVIDARDLADGDSGNEQDLSGTPAVAATH